MQNRSLWDGKISAAHDLQAHHGVTEQEERKGSGQQRCWLSAEDGIGNVHDEMDIVEDGYQRQGIGLILQHSCTDHFRDNCKNDSDRKGQPVYLPPMEIPGVECLGQQKEDHAPKLLDGLAYHQTKVRENRKEQTADQQCISLVYPGNGEQEAQHDGQVAAPNKHLSAGGQDQPIKDQLQRQKQYRNNRAFRRFFVCFLHSDYLRVWGYCSITGYY